MRASFTHSGLDKKPSSQPSPRGRRRSEQCGFTLIELSIVLVIIGLIVGGVLVGQDLIKAATLRAVVTEKESFETAVTTFKLKYNCLPGDCPNATQFFGADTAWVGSYGFKTADGGALTANGNGDGKIEFIEGGGLYRYESMTAWQQLSYAGLIKEKLNGTWQTGSAQFIPGTNAPSTKNADNQGWVITTIETQPAGSLFAGSYGHVLALIPRDSSNGQTGWIYGALTPLDQKLIDIKMDDGMPGTGDLRGTPQSGWGAACTDSSTAASANYLASSSQTGCSPIFITRAF